MSLPRAMDFDPGESFKWQGATYVVLHHVTHEDGGIDNVKVIRTVDAQDNVIPDKYHHDENFNPYAYVERVLKDG